MGACSLSTAVPPAPTATVDLQPTLYAAQTEAAATVSARLAAIPTATPLPPTATLADTSTPLPSNTPLPPTNTVAPLPTLTSTPTITATVVFTPVTPPYACKMVYATTSGVHSGQDFNMLWTLKNVGTNKWEPQEFDIKYISGEKLQTGGDLFDLPKVVLPGESIQISVPMKAPTSTGEYTATWAFAKSTLPMCSLPVYIKVK